jgi:shikimate dehydrogenase
MRPVSDDRRVAATVPAVRGTTRLAVLLGHPVDHSRSPAIMNAAFAHEGLDLVYVALPVAPADLSSVVGALGRVAAVGANVTVPHKLAVLASCDSLTEEARLVGAVNTLHWTPDGLVGHNTDAIGLAAALVRDVGDLGGERALVVGTGGAARAAVVALSRLGAQVSVAGRRQGAARDLLALAGTPADDVDLAGDALADAVTAARIVVNATTVGMHGEHLPAPLEHLRDDQIAYDLIYGRQTPFLTAARGAGATAHDGSGMLLGQAAAAFERWTGRAAPLEVMASALADPSTA